MIEPSVSTAVQPRAEAIHRQLLADLGWKQLSAAWAKLEILLGLTAAGCGVISALALNAPDAWLAEPLRAGSSLTLITLGGYLTLAGHRSHLYQSQTRIAAYLLESVMKRHD